MVRIRYVFSVAKTSSITLSYTATCTHTCLCARVTVLIACTHTHTHTIKHTQSSVSSDWLPSALHSDLLWQIERFQEVSQFVLAGLCFSLQVCAPIPHTHFLISLGGASINLPKQTPLKQYPFKQEMAVRSQEGLQPSPTLRQQR